jgi:hypothetical protein
MAPGADAIRCPVGELGGNRAIRRSGRESCQTLARFPRRFTFGTDPAQIGTSIESTATALFERSTTTVWFEQARVDAYRRAP